MKGREEKTLVGFFLNSLLNQHHKTKFLKTILLFLLACVMNFNLANAQGLKAYQIYNKDKEPVDFMTMITQLNNYDGVLFGEIHNSSINHWLELKTTEALYRIKGGRLILGAEMFERDNQEAVNKYLSGDIDLKKFKEAARLWKNFETDYQPLLDFAKEHGLEFIAANVPRRYAAMVVDHGIDTLKKLPEKEKIFIAKLPINVDMKTPGYKKMKTLMKKHAGDKVMNYVSAQAVKDATMAESILKNREPEQLFLHFHGNYHSKEYGGIYWHLKNKKKRLKIAVISIAESDSMALPLPDDFVATEFNIVIPGDMTKTYIVQPLPEQKSTKKK